ncbi:MAG: hypothetical protein VX835_00340 [Pseudomonadota bacterium]|nr:hypothetical protein [Pseudomonadota bacterium]
MKNGAIEQKKAQTKYTKLMKLIHTSNPAKVVSFIQDNFTESYETKLSSLLTVPLNYSVKIEKKSFLTMDVMHALTEAGYLEAKGKWRPALPIVVLSKIADYACEIDNVESANLKSFPLIYLASLNTSEASSVDMVMFLHKYLKRSINEFNMVYRSSGGSEEVRHEFGLSLAKSDMTLKDRAYRNADMKLFNYLISMHEQNDTFSNKLPPIQYDEVEFNPLMKKYFAQEKLYNAKNYKALFDLMENCELVFSAKALANDRGFNQYCLRKKSEFVTHYLDNAIHDMQFRYENLYGGYIEDKKEQEEKAARNKHVASSLSMFAGLSTMAVGLYSFLRQKCC